MNIVRSKNPQALPRNEPSLRDILKRGESVMYGVFRSYIWRDELSGNSVFRMDTPQPMQFPQQYCDRFMKKKSGHQSQEPWYTITVDASGLPSAACMPKMPLMLTGHFSAKADRGYGWPFVVSAVREASAWESATIQYLASGSFHGIDYALAASIVEVTGADIYSFFCRKGSLVDLMDQVNMDLEDAKNLKDRVLQGRKEQSLFSVLGPMNVPYVICSKAVSRYGGNAYDMLLSDPYGIGQKLGMEFNQCDLLALNNRVAPDSVKRVKAIMEHAIDSVTKNGHVFAEIGQFEKVVRQIERKSPLGKCVIDASTSVKGLDTYVELENGPDGHLRFYDRNLHMAEKRILKNITRLCAGKKKNIGEIPSDFLRKAQEICGIPYGRQQMDAQRILLGSKGISILLGGPGTGKTTTANGLLVEYEMMYPGKKIRLCAPTGRAAQRLSESTGREAVTIHQLLEYRPYDNVYGGDVSCKNASDPLDADLIVCDEASMISVDLMDLLLEAIRSDASLILIGDTAQLESVGPGAVLRDLLTAPEDLIPRAVLTEVFRQKGGSLIIDNAYRINAGQTSLSEGKDFKIFRTRSPEESLSLVKRMMGNNYRKDDPFRIQVLCPSHEGLSGITACNRELQTILNADGRSLKYGRTTYRVSDKIIMKRNNYDPLCNYYNGDIGTIQNVQEKSVDVSIRGNILHIPKNMMSDMALSYAMSIHKSQGSEFAFLIIVLPQSVRSMLTRNLLYTGVTRAKKGLVVISENDALETAITNVNSVRRKTTLAEQIYDKFIKGKTVPA